MVWLTISAYWQLMSMLQKKLSGRFTAITFINIEYLPILKHMAKYDQCVNLKIVSGVFNPKIKDYEMGFINTVEVSERKNFVFMLLVTRICVIMCQGRFV